MPNTREHVRNILDTKPTQEDVGLVCTIKITAYDNGMINVNGSPAGLTKIPGRSSEKWMHATRKVMQILEQFEETFAERQAEQKGRPLICENGVTSNIPAADAAEN
jgi:hypothetical protein